MLKLRLLPTQQLRLACDFMSSPSFALCALYGARGRIRNIFSKYDFYCYITDIDIAGLQVCVHVVRLCMAVTKGLQFICCIALVRSYCVTGVSSFICLVLEIVSSFYFYFFEFVHYFHLLFLFDARCA